MSLLHSPLSSFQIDYSKEISMKIELLSHPLLEISLSFHSYNLEISFKIPLI